MVNVCCSCETNKKFRLLSSLPAALCRYVIFIFCCLHLADLCVYIGGGGEIPLLVVLVLSLPLHHDITFFEFQFGSRSAPSDRATTRDREGSDRRRRTHPCRSRRRAAILIERGIKSTCNLNDTLS